MQTVAKYVLYVKQIIEKPHKRTAYGPVNQTAPEMIIFI